MKGTLLGIFSLKDVLARPMTYLFRGSVIVLVKNNKDMKRFNIFDHLFLYTTYPGNTIFFLEKKESIKELVETFDLYSSFFWFKY